MKRAGEALRRDLEDAGVSQALLAYRTGISTKHINLVLQGKARLSVDVAVQIQAAVPSISAEGLLLLQLRDEIAEARRRRVSG
jgi:HTH-type transcriptional regulator / antitoxin HigA